MTWKGFLAFLGILAAWVALTRVVLPWCGVETCGPSAGRCPFVGQCDAPPLDAESAPKNLGNDRQGIQP